MIEVTPTLFTAGTGVFAPCDLNKWFDKKAALYGFTALVDVRDMVDGAGNPLSLYKEKIDAARDLIIQGHKVVIVCVLGRSRSNAIAAGVMQSLFPEGSINAWLNYLAGFKGVKIHNAHKRALMQLFS